MVGELLVCRGTPLHLDLTGLLTASEESAVPDNSGPRINLGVLVGFAAKTYAVFNHSPRGDNVGIAS